MYSPPFPIAFLALRQDTGEISPQGVLAAIAQRRRPAFTEEVTQETKPVDPAEQHLTRLEEDGRSPITISTHRFTTTELRKSIGGLKVNESTTTRIDAAIRSMQKTHGAKIARQAKSILRGS
jgi:hypothetical protein